MKSTLLGLFVACILSHVGFAQYASEWTSPNLGQYGWGGAYGYDIDDDGLVEYFTRQVEHLIFYNGDYVVEWNISFPGYDYVSVIQPRDIDGDGRVVPLNMDNDAAGEILVVGYYYDTGNYTYYGKFRVYDAGTHALEFESSSITGFYGTATLEDIDGDGRDEIIMARYGASSTSYVDVYAYAGSAVEYQNRQYCQCSSSSTSFPNPSCGEVHIHAAVTPDKPQNLLKVTIYDNTGRKVKTLADIADPFPGDYVFTWDGKDENGSCAPAGQYFVHITTKHKKDIQKIILLW
jgi:hypothetical protein